MRCSASPIGLRIGRIYTALTPKLLSAAFLFSHRDQGSNSEGKNIATLFEYNNEQYLSMPEDTELLDCFLDLPEIIDGANETLPSPLNVEWLQLK